MKIPSLQFDPFPKIARLSREVVISEKIDGTNSTIYIDEFGNIFAGSRTRWISPSDDNYGFASWVEEHKYELQNLGPGIHRGEWWGQGIQRGYGLKEKRLSLFNTIRWCLHGQTPQQIKMQDPRIIKTQDVLPPCVGLVPVLWRGIFDISEVNRQVGILEMEGSFAAPGYKFPEGVVIYHVAANMCFKKTLGDDGNKGGK